jgi:TetR/AcrR family transcriptional regulator, transcriptional repressor for nem operon
MGRPREFDRQEALASAMRVFWARGYDNTSLCELIDSMGISKSSFYETFGSKHDLFLASLDYYRDNVIGLLSLKLETAKSPRAAIVAILRLVLDQKPGAGEIQGCMIGRCAVELAGRDLAAAARVAAGMAQLEDALHGAVVRAQDLGEIPARHDARALARYLTSSLNGLRVMAEAKMDHAVLEDILRITLAALD